MDYKTIFVAFKIKYFISDFVKNMSKFFSKEFLRKIYKKIDWGWKGITILVFTDITKDPKKLKLNFYSIIFPFLILIILIVLLLYDRIEKSLLQEKTIKYYKKQELILYNLYYSLKYKNQLIKKIHSNIIKIYPTKTMNLLKNQNLYQNQKKQNLIQASTKIEEEIIIANLLKQELEIELNHFPLLLLETFWHKTHIYSVIPKGIPMYPGTYNISSGYGYRQDPFHSSEGDFHNGLDFASSQNTPILAAADGLVLKVYNNSNSGYGTYTIIHHGLGFQTLYAHCNQILVQENQFVIEKQVIALVGKSGRATGNHLHYEVRIGYEKPVDPLPFIRIK